MTMAEREQRGYFTSMEQLKGIGINLFSMA
jgi:hypothetical protein